VLNAIGRNPDRTKRSEVSPFSVRHGSLRCVQCSPSWKESSKTNARIKADKNRLNKSSGKNTKERKIRKFERKAKIKEERKKKKENKFVGDK
jgi:hypothetical protein